MRIGIALCVALAFSVALSAQTQTQPPLPSSASNTPTTSASSPSPAPSSTTTPTSKNSGNSSLPRVAPMGSAEYRNGAGEYRLGPGDKLRVEVYKDAQLSQSLQVRPDGKVTLPLIGDIVAAELTPIQLRDRITTSLKEFVTNPVVTVIVVEANPATVFVMGEVTQPGSIPMRGPMTVLQALAMAGGFKEFANTKTIRILRRVGNQAQVQTIRFNYHDAIKGDAAPVFLSPGDMVVVP
jgi:polysaccharide export outer membrane protein